MHLEHVPGSAAAFATFHRRFERDARSWIPDVVARREGNECIGMC